MTERENELKAALAENGTFDSEKAGRFAADGVLQLHGQLKKNDRFLAITTLMCVALLAFCIEKLIFASSTKAIVGFGVTLLYVLVFTVLIKLWYWIVNTRITLQKDLKLWQLQTVTAQPAPAALRELPSVDARDWRGLSRRERAAWVVADVIVALAAGLYVAFYTGLTQSVNEFVSLKPNGDSSSVMRVSQFDRHHFIDYSTRNLKSTLRWLDDRGRELPSCTYTHAGQRYCNARLIDPPLANEVSLEWLNYTQIEDAPAAAQKEGNRWTYEGHRQFDAWRTDCDVTVELPRGATVASCEPQPLMWWQLGDTIRLEFLGTVKKMEPFHYKIVYELPNEAEAEKPPQ